MRLIFMGTPDFAVPTLKVLQESGKHEIVGVYTQQDKETGRGKKISVSPVKQYALEQNIPVFQPKGFKRQEVLDEMKSLNADAIVVVAYGKILRKSVLEMTPYGCFNVHGSLLPKYRGAAPIQWAILDGEEKTGITIMKMDEGLDTGDILLQEEVEITKDETGDSLFEKMSVLGGPLMLQVLEMAQKGNLNPIQQGESPTAYAKMLEKTMGNLDFSEDAIVLERKIRGFNSWPSAYTKKEGKLYKIFKAEVVSADETKKLLSENMIDKNEAGSVIDIRKNDFTILTGKGALKILEIQPEGKKRMDSGSFLRGAKISLGEAFGDV